MLFSTCLTMVWVLNLLLCRIAYGGLPISYPFSNGTHPYGGVQPPYNLIDANPSCFRRGICPMFEPGGRLSAFPNSEEKFQMMMHNMFRQFANVTLDLKYAKYAWGASKTGGLTQYCKGCKYCGETHPEKVPLYWYSDANQAARFKQYDENACNQSWYYLPGETFHSTCGLVLPEYGGGSHCDLFRGSCTMSMRNFAFCNEDDCWFDTEGICGANTCVTDGHCDPIFANKYDYQGAGFVEGMNGAATVYARKTDEISYLLPMATHFDERIRLPYSERNRWHRLFTLMVEYFDVNHTQTPVNCWSLYNGEYHEMNVTVSEVGSIHEGFSKDSYSVIFHSNHPPVWRCHPYAFICKTSANNYVRLPEDSNYYFGTEFIDWKWSNYAKWGNGYQCKENHYYNNGVEWLVNGDPALDKCDIWYYQDTEQYGTCLGCNKINILDCWAQCIYSNFTEEECQCNGIWGPWEKTPQCTSSPTLDPTEATLPPTNDPTATTLYPTFQPSLSPTVDPTNSPTETTFNPTIPPTNTPTDGPTSPTYEPTLLTFEPTSPPTHSPLTFITPNPSFAPTQFVEVCCNCLVDTAPSVTTVLSDPISGCSVDPQCEAHVCNVDASCCNSGWSAQCVSIASGKCLGTGDPTRLPTPVPIQSEPNKKTKRPTRRRRPPIFH